jgi:dTDP-4-amino-4,6-dideoxygalactose transaminase
MRLMRHFGFAGFDNVVYPGTNGKMIEACAAVGLANLDGIDAVVAANRRNLDDYRAALAGIDGISLIEYDAAERNNFQYVVMEVSDAFAASRDRIVDVLQAENLLVRRYFWPGCHRMRPYRDLNPHAGLLLPHTEAIARRVVVLPTGTTLPDTAAGVVADVIGVLARGA